ncbi:MAG: glycoside hydrolase family protein [Rikenellaceae bacterium]
MKTFLTLIATALMLNSCTTTTSEPKELEYEITLGKVPTTAVFKNGDETTWSVWGASMIKDDNGLYHIFYSRWPKANGWVWAVDSEIARATSTSPYGPWEFQEIVLPRRGVEYWDGWCTHNPTIHKFGDKYYLYYMGTTGDGREIEYPISDEVRWLHRNNQRIGVAVADSPTGPWTRFDKPTLDVSSDDTAPDCLITNNPAVSQTPDGRYLLLYKTAGKKKPLPVGGPVVHMVAFSDSPTGPFVKEDVLVFAVEGNDFPAEDPTIWYQDGKYRAIVKEMASASNDWHASLIHYDSEDGIHWTPGKFQKVSDRQVTWEDGQHYKLSHLERPQIFMENGEPLLILFAADTTDVNNVLHSFNIQVPVNIKKHEVE